MAVRYDDLRKGVILRRLRESKGLTRKQFADVTGIPLSQIYPIETGRKCLAKNTVNMIERSFALEPGSLAAQMFAEASYPFDFSLSFAGEDRAIAEKMASLLIAEGATVFYDNFYRSELFGKKLGEYFQLVFASWPAISFRLFQSIIPGRIGHYMNSHWPRKKKSAETLNLSCHYVWTMQSFRVYTMIPRIWTCEPSLQTQQSRSWLVN